MKLSPEEISFFKEEGYLIKRKVMDEALMAKARDRLWDNKPVELDRNKPETWVGPIKAYKGKIDVKGDKSRDSIGKGNEGQNFRWHFRSIGDEDWIVRMLATDPSIWAMAEQILGVGKVQIPDQIRGIYCSLPEGDIPLQPHRCHTDAHAFHLGVVGYIDDVPPNGGGFIVWPKSHRTFYHAYQTQHGNDQAVQYDECIEKFNQLPYVECHGEAGDIVFWHHRLAHTAGHNRSQVIRKAVLYDFRKVDLEEKTKEPPCEDMWRDWPGVQQSDTVSKVI